MNDYYLMINNSYYYYYYYYEWEDYIHHSLTFILIWVLSEDLGMPAIENWEMWFKKEIDWSVGIGYT